MRLFVPPDRLQKRVDELHQRLRPVFLEMGEHRAREFDGHAQGLKSRLATRAQSLVQQNSVTEPRPLAFNSEGVAPLTRWAPRQETPDARLEALEGNPKRFAIAAGAGGRCVASWRMKVLLPAGRYRFEARARTQGVQALQEGPGTGLGIRLSGSQRVNKLDGTSNWAPLAHEFQIHAPTQEVELVAELRATAGQGFFDAGSLRLVRVKQ
jgi:hypothetical protein